MIEKSDADPNDLINVEDRQRPLKMLTRKLPLVLDISIFIMQLVIFVGYCYMTFFYGELNAIKCLADPHLDKPLNDISSVQGIDVTRRFRIAITWGFWMSFLNFARATLAQVAFYLKMWVLLLISYTMFAINIAILIILFVMM